METANSLDAQNPARSAARPGLILSAIAAICLFIILIPPVGALIILYLNGVLTLANTLKIGGLLLSTFGSILSPERPFMVVLAIPFMLIFVFSIVYLVAFFLRAAWGPRVLSALAVIWAISVKVSTIVMPLMAMPGSLPAMTFLAMIPGLIAPLIFAIGFTGFMLHSDVVRAWFATIPKDTSPQETRA